MAGKPKSLIEAGDDDYKVGYCKPPRHTRFNARSEPDLDRLMGDQRAAAAFLDPPYNVSIKGVVGRGRRKHGEFAMASGEMSRGEFVSFLTETLCNATTYSREGAVHYVCMDWRHLGELIEAGREIYSEMLNLAVWVKSNAGQGSFLPLAARIDRRV